MNIFNVRGLLIRRLFSSSSFLSFFLSFVLFRVAGIWRFPGWGQIGAAAAGHSHSQIRAVPATYTTAPGNVRSLIPWGRSEIELVTSWILVGFVTG